MAIKDTASEMLKRLEEGTGEIYARYRDLASATDAQYQSRLNSLDADYAGAANSLTGKSRAGLRDSLTSLADLGLQNSGAAQQVRLSSDMALMNSLGQLSAQHTKERSEVEAERSSAARSLAKEGEEQAQSYRGELYKLLLQQQNADREYELEAQKLALQKQTAAQDYQIKQQQLRASSSSSSSRSSSGSGTTESGLTLAQTPDKLMETILQSSRKYNEKGKYYYVDRSSVQARLTELLKDTRISEAYRYRLYAQARAMGYIK